MTLALAFLLVLTVAIFAWLLIDELRDFKRPSFDWITAVIRWRSERIQRRHRASFRHRAMHIKGEPTVRLNVGALRKASS